MKKQTNSLSNVYQQSWGMIFREVFNSSDKNRKHLMKIEEQMNLVFKKTLQDRDDELSTLRKK